MGSRFSKLQLFIVLFETIQNSNTGKRVHLTIIDNHRNGLSHADLCEHFKPNKSTT